MGTTSELGKINRTGNGMQPGSMPDRGTSTGATDTYGADISGDATNSMGGMGSATKSESPFENCACVEFVIK